MAFLDELGKKITQGGQGVVQKTKGIADSAKLSAQISAEERRINTLYGQLGKEYYDVMMAMSEMPSTEECVSQLLEKTGSLCANITSSKKRIAAYQTEMNHALQGGGKICPACGSKNQVDNVFCEECGHRMNIAANEQNNSAVQSFEQENLFCQNCGAKLPIGSQFCMDCGTKIED